MRAPKPARVAPFVFAALVLGVAACRPEPQPTTKPEGVEQVFVEQPNAEQQPAASQTKPVVYLVGTQLWRVEPDGSKARALGAEAQDVGGMLGAGGSEPMVSPDGRFVALNDGVDLRVLSLETGEILQLTKLPHEGWLHAATGLLSGWSPDSSMLLFALIEPGYEEADPLPLPPGVEYGFHVFRVSESSVERLPTIEGFTAWLPDSSGVLFDKHNSARDYDLLELPLDGGAAKVRRHSDDSYGFSQLVVDGEQLVWVQHGADGQGAQVVAAPLAGGDAVAKSVNASFAEIQWPRVSPDGSQIVYQRRPDSNGPITIELAMGESNPPKPITTCAGFCPVDWYDDERLLVITSEGLCLIGLDGSKVVLDAKATGLAVYGN